MGYQEDCEWFALHGDQASEDADYEFNARYDYQSEAFGAEARALNQMALDDEEYEAAQEAAFIGPRQRPFIDDEIPF